ncbi:MAG TPA: class I SAM-dependent methyltransferase [Xanthobacteraceae bacterium]|nr:class I SAM-dependent methyltransferase [Xanthobacteraceae bacterium]
MRAWIDWYDSPQSIYANERHRDVHFRRIAQDIARYVPGPHAVVLDYGCGEALHAGIVAGAAARLILAEPAPGVRARVAARFAGDGRITVCDLDGVAALPEASVDLVVMHSVIQYMTAEELDVALRRIRRLLKPSGLFVLGDVIAPDTPASTDALALLRFGLAEGFFIAAGVSLARLLLSSYWRLRSSLGLSRYDAPAITARLAACGFSASRQPANIGHNQARMTFLCRPA